jgi:hypothetical protein
MKDENLVMEKISAFRNVGLASVCSEEAAEKSF